VYTPEEVYETDQNTYVVAGLSHNTVYRFEVTALNEAGEESAKSAFDEVRTKPIEVTDVEVSNVTDRSCVVQWQYELGYLFNVYAFI
jgi:hypothetical protein